ncbi:MAG: translocase, partial [Deltaproteobacteria bacterium]|nr:translocase [Deltaproteobacteria bacterium]
MDESQGTSSETKRPSVLDRALRVFSDVRPGESGSVLLLLSTIFLIMLSYYVIKTVREPLILLGGGAELKSYASAAQAGVLMVFVPLYSKFAERVDRFRLIVGVTLFFALCIQVFFAAGQAALPIGFVFFVWVGIFNVAII